MAATIFAASSLVDASSLSWLNIGNWISDNDISDAAVSFRDKASATILCLPSLYSTEKSCPNNLLTH